MLGAALLLGLSPLLGRRITDSLAVTVAGATAATDIVLLLATLGHGTVLHWFGGWRPQGGVAIGIVFAVDPMGAGLATFIAVAVTSALLYSWRYLQSTGALYQVLMLVFLAGMTGFSLTGDLFDLFVFFELTSVSAYALTGLKVQEERSLEGALNFAITNSVGAFLILAGIAVLYAHTGQLNMAALGQELARQGDGRTVRAAFVLVLSGFLVKGAAAPFHFWHADAHAVAPATVCALFSGVMTPLGLYGAMRVYWTVFSGVFGSHAIALRGALETIGVLTLLVGSSMCFLQRNIKRLLAFSTISHMGVVIVGFALLTPRALAGAADYVVAHGLFKIVLFQCAGVLLHRCGSVDEIALRGCGRRMYVTGALYAISALALADAPGLLPSTGSGLVEHAAIAEGQGWLVPVMMLSTGLAAAAILRAGGRIFLLPPRGGRLRGSEDEGRETRGSPHRTPPTMLVSMIALTALALSLGVTGIDRQLLPIAARFMDRRVYAEAVLGTGRHVPAMLAAAPVPGIDWAYTVPVVAGAVLLAAAFLYRRRMPAAMRYVSRRFTAAIDPVAALHSGDARDYVAWLVVGVAALSVFAETLL